MKFYLVIDETIEESVVVTAHSKSEKVIAIEALVNDEKNQISAYKDKEIYIFSVDDVVCFFSLDNKIYIYKENDIYLVKYRMYQIEKFITKDFIKINQGCIVNKNYIKKFQPSIGGALKVVLNNGFEDYISRRELIKVKSSLGL